MAWIKYSVEELKDRKCFSRACRALAISESGARKMGDGDELYILGQWAEDWGIGPRPLKKKTGGVV